MKLAILLLVVIQFFYAQASPLDDLSYCHRLVCAVLKIKNHLDGKMEKPVNDLVRYDNQMGHIRILKNLMCNIESYRQHLTFKSHFRLVFW